jgi:hypothetical protein
MRNMGSDGLAREVANFIRVPDAASSGRTFDVYLELESESDFESRSSGLNDRDFRVEFMRDIRTTLPIVMFFLAGVGGRAPRSWLQHNCSTV